MRRRKRRKQRKIIIISSLTLLFIMTVGYAAFQTNINITAKGNILEKGITINDLKKLTVTSGDGLYKDTYETGRYIYKGANPENYILFNNELWRIISIEIDSTLKIIKNEPLENAMAYDTNGQNSFTNSTLSIYLNSGYYETLIEKDKIVAGNFYSGILEPYTDKSITQIINLEKQEIFNDKIGLLSFSEYMKGSNNNECKSFVDARVTTPNSPCHEDNYLHNLNYRGGIWLLNSSSTSRAYCMWNQIDPFGISLIEKNTVFHPDDNLLKFKVQPVLFLVYNITLKGKGTETNPYIIN